MMKKLDVWFKDGCALQEVYRTSYSGGSRYSLLGRSSSYNLRPGNLGVNGWATRTAVHKFLTERGYAPLKEA